MTSKRTVSSTHANAVLSVARFCLGFRTRQSSLRLRMRKHAGPHSTSSSGGKRQAGCTYPTHSHRLAELTACLLVLPRLPRRASVHPARPTRPPHPGRALHTGEGQRPRARVGSCPGGRGVRPGRRGQALSSGSGRLARRGAPAKAGADDGGGADGGRGGYRDGLRERQGEPGVTSHGLESTAQRDNWVRWLAVGRSPMARVTSQFPHGRGEVWDCADWP